MKLTKKLSWNEISHITGVCATLTFIPIGIVLLPYFFISGDVKSFKFLAVGFLGYLFARKQIEDARLLMSLAFISMCFGFIYLCRYLLECYFFGSENRCFNPEFSATNAKMLTLIVMISGSVFYIVRKNGVKSIFVLKNVNSKSKSNGQQIS